MRGPKLTVYPKGVLLETYRRRLIALRDDGFNDDFMAALEEVHRQLEKHDALAARLATCERERDAAIRGHDAAHAACVDYEARLAEAEQDIEQWKKVYDLRGRALQRPCINCGYVPQVIRPADSASVGQEK